MNIGNKIGQCETCGGYLYDFKINHIEQIKNQPRESFKLTEDLIHEMSGEDGWETIEEDESHYKHSMTNYEFISKRESDGKFFKWRFTADYNNGIEDWSMDEVLEVFPVETTKVVIEYV